MTTREKITVYEPELEATKSVAGVKIASPLTINSTVVGTGAYIEKALENKDNSLQITVTNSGTKKAIIFKAGDTYPNRILGDLAYDIDASSTVVIMLSDISRFENKDKTINIDFESGFTGSMYAVAKHAGIRKLPEA